MGKEEGEEAGDGGEERREPEGSGEGRGRGAEEGEGGWGRGRRKKLSPQRKILFPWKCTLAGAH